MATRNIVPRATGEGSIGTSAKTWSAVYANDIAVTNGVSASTFTGNLTGTASGNLALTGGTLTGSIQYVDNGKVFAIENTNPGNVNLGWNWVNREGAGIGLRSVAHLKHPGEFSLFARDSANSCSLDGKPDGTLKWNDKEVERVNAKGHNYIRYESGLQICWGYADTPSNGIFTVTFSSAFIDISYAMNVTGLPASTGKASSRMTSLSGVSGDRTTTSFKGTIVNASNTVQATGVIYIAIGLWK